MNRENKYFIYVLYLCINCEELMLKNLMFALILYTCGWKLYMN